MTEAVMDLPKRGLSEASTDLVSVCGINVIISVDRYETEKGKVNVEITIPGGEHSFFKRLFAAGITPEMYAKRYAIEKLQQDS